MQFKQIPTNQVEVVVKPRNKGDFGFVSISGCKRSPQEEYRLAEEIKNNINRHVDDVGSVHIRQENLYEAPSGEQYESLYEALCEELSDCQFGYAARYELPSDKGVGTRTARMSFEKLIETAYQNPWNFRVMTANPPLSNEQQEFLDAVIKAGLESKEPAKVGAQQ